MGFNCGIVGLPNVGKSTLFNALTNTAAAKAANYPFCTIDPNIGRVSVPDKRLYELAAIAESQNIIPTQLEFVDIAGLVKGASKGEGLGNQFLGNIREVDTIVQVLRCFDDDDITHVDGNVDPIRDIDTIETELILADLESVEKRIPNLERKARGKDKEAIATIDLLKRVEKILSEGKPARKLELSDADKPLFKQLQLLSSKPILYVCNVAEDEITTGNDYTKQVQEKAKETNSPCVTISARIESEIATLDSEEEKQAFLEDLGLEETGLSQIIHAGYALLDLITFFTVGPKEARAWTVKKGTAAPQTAGVIHTDFETGFIRAETTSCNDFLTHKGEQGAKEAGKLRLEGKDYITQDGDVMHFRFNV